MNDLARVKYTPTILKSINFNNNSKTFKNINFKPLISVHSEIVYTDSPIYIYDNSFNSLTINLGSNNSQIHTLIDLNANGYISNNEILNSSLITKSKQLISIFHLYMIVLNTLY